MIAARLARSSLGRRAIHGARWIFVPMIVPAVAASLACALIAGVAIGQDRSSDSLHSTDGVDVSSGGFTLHLVPPSPSGEPVSGEPSRFNLGLIDRTPDDGPGSPNALFSVPNLSFDAGNQWEDRPVDTIDLNLVDLSGVLVKRRPVDPVELHMMAELERVIPGYRPQGLLFSLDVDAIVRGIREWRHRRRERRLPVAASLPRDGSVELVVREAVGGSPAHISVVPLTDGWVGDVIHANCSESGRCRVEGLPLAPSTLFVRGHDAALVPWRPLNRELVARLRPTGSVRVVALPLGNCSQTPVRVVDEATGLVVPVLSWRNPDRGMWTPLGRSGLPLILPDGVYRLEIEGEQRPVAVEVFTVVAGRDIEVAVEECAGPHP